MAKSSLMQDQCLEAFRSESIRCVVRYSAVSWAERMGNVSEKQQRNRSGNRPRHVVVVTDWLERAAGVALSPHIVMDSRRVRS